MEKVAVAENAKLRSYYKYYEMEIAGLSQQQMQAVAAGKGNPKDALLLADRNEIFQAGDLPGENGYFPMEDGSLHIACKTLMPEVTGEMLYWWFAWHGLEPLRYAIWDNEDHFDVQMPKPEDRERILNSKIPIEEKMYGVTHEVLESMGGPASKICIMFQDPKDLGYDITQIGTDACEFFTAANSFIAAPDGNKIPAVMSHMGRKAGKGLEFRSRFWIGWNIIEGNPVKLLPDGIQIPVEIGIGLYGHCMKEYQHLAKILPDVYKEERDNWL